VYQKKGYALLCGKIGYYPLDKQRAINVKTKEDLKLAEYIMKVKQNETTYEVTYDPLVKKFASVEKT
jgi:hypothetical protein